MLIRHFYFDISFNTKGKHVGAIPKTKIIMRSLTIKPETNYLQNDIDECVCFMSDL